MKKFLLILVAAITIAVTAFAAPLSSRAMFQGDRKTVYMEPNGYCYFDSRQTGRINGSYDVDGTVQPGCSNVTVTFNFGGEIIRGTLMWPTEEGLKLYFEGTIMNKVL